MRLAIKYFFLSCLVLAVLGCSEPGLTPIPSNGKILAFGDSLTRGVGTDSEHAYPAILASLSGKNVVNAGISGETTTGGMTRMAAVLAQHQPDLLILLEGGNDILRNHPQTTIKANLAGMIEMAQESDVQVVLLGVPEKSLLPSVPSLYSELAETYDLVFEEDLVSDLLRTSEYKSDTIHLNAAGYRVLAEELDQILRARGAY